MNILAIDLSTDACSVAVSKEGTVTQRFEPGHRPSRMVLRLIEELLAEANLALSAIDGIAFGRGPGAFTGLRIAAGVAQGLSFGLDKPVLGVSSLQALAQAAYVKHGTSQVAAMLDARMNEVYAAHFAIDDDGFMQLQGSEELLPPDSYHLPEGFTGLLAGPGWSAYPVLAGFHEAHRLDDSLRPEAGAIASLSLPLFKAGHGGSPETAIPVYLRDKVAWQRER